MILVEHATVVTVDAERRIFADHFLERAQASLDDLEARAALRDATGL